MTWQSLTETLVKAVQDLDYLVRATRQPFDYSIASGERTHDRFILEAALQIETRRLERDMKLGYNFFAIAESDKTLREKARAVGLWWEDSSTKEPEPLGASLKYFFRYLLFRRASAVLACAIFLILPMEIMVLRQTLYLNSAWQLALSSSSGLS